MKLGPGQTYKHTNAEAPATSQGGGLAHARPNYLYLGNKCPIFIKRVSHVPRILALRDSPVAQFRSAYPKTDE